MSSARNIPALAVTLLLTLSLLPVNVSSVTAARPNSAERNFPAQAQTPPEALKIRRLKPSVFAELPTKIVRELERRGCTIPQVTLEGLEMQESPPQNVVSGEFARKGQKDWAALCSRRGQTAIHIFWGKPTKCPSIIGVAPDNTERYLGVADAKYILVHYEAYGGPKPPPRLLHQGLNDGFAESASQVWYCYRGKWRVLQGAD